MRAERNPEGMPPLSGRESWKSRAMTLTHLTKAQSNATRSRATRLTGIAAALALLATGAMSMAPPEGPVRMSATLISELPGYQVEDRTGERVGKIVGVDINAEGRTRWLHIALDAGGEAKVASFRAWVDASRKTVALLLSEDLLISRADAAVDPTAEAKAV